MATSEDIEDIESKFRRDDHEGHDGGDPENHDPDGHDYEGEDDDDEVPEKKKKFNVKMLALPVAFVALMGGWYGYQSYLGTSSQTPVQPQHYTPKVVHNGVNPLSVKGPGPIQTASNDTAPVQPAPTFGQNPVQPNVPDQTAQPSPAIGGFPGATVPSAPGLNKPDALPNGIALGAHKAGVNNPGSLLGHPDAVPGPSTDDVVSLASVLSSIHDNGKSIDDAQKDINKHVDAVGTTVEASTQKLEGDIVALQSKLTDISNKLGDVDQKADAVNDTLKTIQENGVNLTSKKQDKKDTNAKRHALHVPGSGTAHRIVHHTKKEAKATPVDTNGLIQDYHLRGVSRDAVVFSGPNGYFKVGIGSQATQNGAPVPALGVVNGLEKRGDRYVVHTSTGIVAE